MSLTYADAAALVFGTKPFTVPEFARRTGSPRAAKTLSELKRRGLVARIGRGRYRYLEADERADPRAEEGNRARRAILDAGLPMAWTGSSAVEVWTAHRYYVGPSVFLRVFHLVVPAKSLDAWRAYLRSRRISSSNRRSIGVRVVLEPVRRMPALETVEGERVISREAALEIVRANRAAYAAADKLFLKRPHRA